MKRAAASRPPIDSGYIDRILGHVESSDQQMLTLENAVAKDSSVLGPLLASAWARRRIGHKADSRLLPAFGHRLLASVPAADYALSRNGGGWPFIDLIERDPWATELRRGLDVGVQICVLLRNGMTLAAVARARRYLERWTFNVASFHEVTPQQPGESDPSYIERVWSVYNGLGGSPGEDWAKLSELLHGRSVSTGHGRVSISDDGFGTFALHNLVVRAIELPYLQVRGGVDNLLQDSAGSTSWRLPLAPVRLLPSVPTAERVELKRVLNPADIGGVLARDGRWSIEFSENYRRHMDNHSGLERNYESSVTSNDAQDAFIERVGRTNASALLAFQLESEHPGSAPLDFGPLAAKLFRYWAISGMARYLGTDAAEPGASALKSAAVALDASWWLWLEDTDDSLITVRSLVEMVAVSRTFRLKPDKAAKLLSAGPLTSPSRWVEAAGWGRLGTVVRALGEFSHVTPRMRSGGARTLLEEIQENGDPVLAQHGARREILDEAAYMLAHEVVSRLEGRYPNLHKAFGEAVTLLSPLEHERKLTDWLERALARRKHDFGQPDMASPDK